MYRGRYRARTAGSVWAIAITTAILDRVTTAPWSAHSIRKLRAAYAGNAFRVRRASDNAEQDIGFSADGRLDTSALLTFCAATNGFVTTWYDQTGNNRHLVQLTAASQPQIVNAGAVLRQDNNPVLVMAAGRWMSTRAVAPTFAQPYSRSTVFQIDTRAAGANIAGGFGATDGRLVQSAANTLSMNAGTDVVVHTGAGTGASGQFTIAELYDGASSTRSVNGVVATINPGTNSGSPLVINANPSLGTEIVAGQTYTANSAGVTGAVNGASFAAAANGANASFAAGLVVGEHYEITYTVSGLTSGAVYVDLGGASDAVVRTANGTYTERKQVVGNTQFYVGAAAANTTASVTVSSIRQIVMTSTSAIRMTEAIFWNAALDATSRQTLTLNQRQFYTTP